MDLIHPPQDTQRTVTKKGQTAKRVRAQKVLEEDEYSTALGKIIERDFFPDLPVLRAKNEQLKKLQALGVRIPTEKVKEILKTPAIHDGSPPPLPPTPSSILAVNDIINQPTTTSQPSHSFSSLANASPPRMASFNDPETPLILHSNSHSPSASAIHPSLSSDDDFSEEQKRLNDGKQQREKLSLGEFQSAYTSEDSASFSELLEKDKQAYRDKYFWIEDQVKIADENKRLLTGTEEEKKGLIDTWRFQAKNALMYHPTSHVERKESETAALVGKKKVVYENTRFPGLSGMHKYPKKEVPEESASATAGSKPSAGGDSGGGDGGDSPKVGGYGFLLTPQIVPGQGGESPMMTWGDVVGTPMHLSAEDGRDVDSGPAFKIPPLPRKDRLVRKLVEKAGKRLSLQRNIQKGRSRRSTTPSISSSSRLSTAHTAGSRRPTTPMMFSPAARRLMSRSRATGSRSGKATPLINIGGADQQLRNSYSTPQIHPSSKTPIGTPSFSDWNRSRSSSRKRSRTPMTPMTPMTPAAEFLIPPSSPAPIEMVLKLVKNGQKKRKIDGK